MSSESWEQSVTARIGAAVKQLRGKGRSAQWLAEQTARLGHPIGRATISEIETGRRQTVTVAELLVLARALDTSPVMLMFPRASDDVTDVVEVLPGLQVTEFKAAQWFSGTGRAFLPEQGDLKPGDYGREVGRIRQEYDANTAKLRLARAIDQWREQLYSIVIPIGGELTDKQREYRDYCETRIEDLLAELAVIDGVD